MRLECADAQEKVVPVNYSISTEERLVLVIATGIVTREDMDGLHHQVLADAQIEPGMRLVFEAGDADSQLTFTDLQEIAARLSGIFDRGIGKVAVVADSSYVYSLAKTFAVFAANEPVRMKPFRHREEAMEWLNSRHSADETHSATIEPQSIVERDDSLVELSRSRRKTPRSTKRAG